MYTRIKVQCIDQELTLVEEPVLSSGGKNEDVIEFTFCNLWAGMGKVAVFWHEKHPKDVYSSVITMDENGNNECFIPHEILAHAGRFFFGVMGVKDDTRRTTTTLAFNIKNGVSKKGMQSAPTQTVYEQLLSDYAACTEMMEGIVANAQAAQKAASKASVDAQNAQVAAEAAARDAAREAVEAAQETVNSAVTAAQAAQAAAEDAAATARGEVLGMGVLLYASGTYGGTGSAWTYTLPKAPRVLVIAPIGGAVECGGTMHDYYDNPTTLINGATAKATYTENTAYISSAVSLSGNQLSFAPVSSGTGSAKLCNRSGVTYNWIALYQ